MHKFIGIALIASGLLAASFAHAKKPTICMQWKESKLKLEGDTKEEPVAICTDGKKPVILTTYKLVEVLDEGGVPVKAVVGWR